MEVGRDIVHLHVRRTVSKMGLHGDCFRACCVYTTILDYVIIRGLDMVVHRRKSNPTLKE